MTRIAWIYSVALIALFISCASLDIKEEKHFNADFISKEYGIRFTAPTSFKLVDISKFDEGNAFELVYADGKRNGRFFIRLFKNYCGLNDIDPKYTWGHLKGCVAYQMKLLENGNNFIVESSHHVYAAQAIYFKTGSFVSPTIVFDKKVTFDDSDSRYNFKSLGYAYKYNNSYFLIEAGYITKDTDYEYNVALYSDLLKSVVYP